jgi:hypothetical protein
MELSGLVVILDEDKNIVEVRDLGDKPVSVKSDIVFPLSDVKEPLNKNEIYGEPTITISDGVAWRKWPVVKLGPVNFPLTARQLRLGLLASGFSIAVIEANLPDEVSKVWWEYSDIVEWNHPMRLQLTQLLQLTDEEASAMWMAAKDL